MSVRLAVIIPCHNKGKVIAAVIQKAKQVLPDAKAYAYNNNSSDNTVQTAGQTDAIVRFVSFQRKETSSFGHRFENMFLTFLVRFPFRIKSAFNFFPKRFASPFSACSDGFDTETKLNVFTNMNELSDAEIETNNLPEYKEFNTKQSTLKKHFKILIERRDLLKIKFSFLFHSLLTSVCEAATILFSLSFAYTDVFPFEFYFTGFCFFLLCGVLLNGQLRNKRENVRLTYLSYPFINNDDKD